MRKAAIYQFSLPLETGIILRQQRLKPVMVFLFIYRKIALMAGVKFHLYPSLVLKH